MFFEKIANQTKIIFISILFILFLGISTFCNISKEQNPDVKVPLIYTSIQMRGISAEDAERLILRPIEKKFKGISNVKKISSQSVNGYASIAVEFNAGFDVSTALTKIKDKINEARSELPKEIEEPIIKEIDFSKFPVLNIAIYGNLNERELMRIGRFLQKKIEMIPNVLEVNLIGDRKDLVEIFVNPSVFNKYKITPHEISSIVNSNNKLISGGFLNLKKSSSVISSESVLKTITDIGNTPLIARDKNIVKVKDIGRLNKSFIESSNVAYINGKQAVVLEVSKRYGANIIQTIDSIKKLIENEREFISNDVKIEYSRDSSKEIIDSLSDLGNNVIFAVILVVVIVVSQLGKKQGIITGMSIPISFFIGIIAINFLGYTLNMVVLFALILASGMIVDASIIVTEYADRLMSQGETNKTAYFKAASRMSAPVLSATIGIIIVYFPLLLWPGIVGQFMKFIPITIIGVLFASIVSALVFIPVLGYIFGSITQKDKTRHEDERNFMNISETGNVLNLTGFTGIYISSLNKILNFPKKIILFVCIGFVISIISFKLIGRGVQFFPSVDAKNIQVIMHSGGNINLEEKTTIMRDVEQKLFQLKGEVKMFYTKIFGNSGNQNGAYDDDIIGVVNLDLVDWNKRPNSDEITLNIKDILVNQSGGLIEILQERPGPRSGAKSIQIEIMSANIDKLNTVFNAILNHIKEDSTIKDLSTSLPSDKFKIDINFNKPIALKYGINAETLSGFIKMCTNGSFLTNFRPDYSNDSVDVVLKFEKQYCNIDKIPELSLYSNQKMVKLGSISTITMKKDFSVIKKIDGNIALTISSNLQVGENIAQKVSEIDIWIKEQKFDKDVFVKFAGEDEDSKETGDFLAKAFGTAIFLKIAILIGQFKYIYYALVVMSSVILSIMGVLFGLILTGKSFGIVMCGLGVISLAGIVVSNNIILIDTYQRFIKEGLDVKVAILRTCAQRFRPILMTSATTIIGLIPMVGNFSIDFFDTKIVYNSPGGQWWEQLSTTIASGLLFATVFTLFLTPCCLLLHTPETHSNIVKKPHVNLITKLKSAIK